MLRIARNLTNLHLRHYCGQASRAVGPLSTRFHQYLSEKSLNLNDLQEMSKIRFQTKSLTEIDSILSKELKGTSLDSSKIFQLFDGIFKIDSNIQLPRTNFFRDALSILIANLMRSFDKEHFIKLCFYVSFFKKNEPGPDLVKTLFNEFLEKSLNSGLSTMDIAIISLTSYKSSVRIENEKFCQKIIDEFIKMDENDEFLLVAFLKCLRLNKVKTDQILDKLKSLNYSKHDYRSLIHILPYLADNGINDPDLIEKMTKRCIETFNNSSRVKEIQKFLHSCALLNIKMNNEHLKEIERIIVAATEGDEYKKFYDHFVNAALSLWIMDYKCVDLVKIIFKDRRFYEIGPYSRIKLDSRMKLLSTCVEIECPEQLTKIKFRSFNEERPAPAFLIRKSHEKVMAEKFKDQRSARFVYQIKNLNIPAILVNNGDGTKTHCEVLDDFTTLADKSTPNGLFALKLRLLKKLECDVKIIHAT